MASSLICVLTRFRQGQVTVMANVESMLHQVKVKPVDTDLLRFLWWPDSDVSQELQEYRMEVVWCHLLAKLFVMFEKMCRG